jgi:replication factor C large subunit
VASLIVPWTELYRPKNLGEVVGNESAVKALRKWFDSWSPNEKRKAALLHGAAGIGKTSSVVALAQERGYELVEMNASDKRNKKAILQIAGSSSKEGTLANGSTGKRILLIDEVDGITGREDRGGVSSLVKVIKAASIPIICTANDAYSKKLKSLRKISKVIAFRPIHPEYIIKVLKRILKDQKIALQEKDLLFIAEQARGDLRSAINDLQGMMLQTKSGKISDIQLLQPFRNQTKDVQQALTSLFTADSFLEGKQAVDGVDLSYDELLLWVYQNADKHSSKKQLPEVYETIAAADRFLGRIRRRQKWKLLSYYFDLISGGVAVTTDQPKKLGRDYTYPQKIALYARTMFQRRIVKSISTNIAEKMHISTHRAQNEVLSLVREIMNTSVGAAAELAYWLELDDNQIKSLLKDRKRLSRIKKVIAAFEKERMKHQTAMSDLKHSSFDLPKENWIKTLNKWEEKKNQLAEEEKQRKEEEKAKQKAKKKKAAKTNNDSSEEKDDEAKQASLDQFF